jgi:transcriptional regulator with XRE-family HTH domain
MSEKNYLQKIRKIKGLEIKEFAEQLGLHPSTIDQWEVDAIKPSKAEITQIASVLNLSDTESKNLEQYIYPEELITEKKDFSKNSENSDNFKPQVTWRNPKILTPSSSCRHQFKILLQNLFQPSKEPFHQPRRMRRHPQRLSPQPTQLLN